MAELRLDDIRRTVTAAITAAQPIADLRSALQNIRTDLNMLRDKQNQVLNAERYTVDMHQMFQRFAANMQNGQVLVTYMQQTSTNLAYLQQRLANMEQYAAAMSDYMASLQQQLGNLEVLQHQLVMQYQAAQKAMVQSNQASAAVTSGSQTG